jgi:hypothetical protein
MVDPSLACLPFRMALQWERHPFEQERLRCGPVLHRQDGTGWSVDETTFPIGG